MTLLYSSFWHASGVLSIRAVRRRHSVFGGGAAPVPKIGGGGAALRGRPKESLPKIPEKIFFYPQNFLKTFFSDLKLQQNSYAATKLSAAAAARRSPINKSRRRRPQIVGDSGARLYFQYAFCCHMSRA